MILMQPSPYPFAQPAYSLPDNLPNPTTRQYWFSADTEAYTDAAGTIQAADGDLVYTWRNQGEEVSDAIQAASGSRPVYRTGGLNGKPYLDCSGNKFFDDLLGCAQPSAISTHTHFTAFAVIENTPAANAWIFGASEVSSGTDAKNNFALGNGGNDFFIAKWEANTALPNGPTGANIIMGARTGSAGYRRGTHAANVSSYTQTTNAPSGATNGLRFLRHGSTPGGYFNGRLYEVILYHGADLGTVNSQTVLDYLKDKYQVT